MNRIVLLDTCVLSRVLDPDDEEDTLRGREWIIDLRRKGTHVRIPELADYEWRRELTRIAWGEAIDNLNKAKKEYGFVPLCEASMQKAAELWAKRRNEVGGNAQTNPRLDGDVIISAQAYCLSQDEGVGVVVATDNGPDFLPYVDGAHLENALELEDIDP